MSGRKVGSKECPQENSFEMAWRLIFGTLFGYPLGQKSRRGTPEAQGLEHKVQGPEHMSSNMFQALCSGAFGRLPGTALGGLGAFSGPKCIQKGCQKDVRKGSKGS